MILLQRLFRDEVNSIAAQLSSPHLWLKEDLRKVDLLKELLRPYPALVMNAHPVRLLVNNPASEGAQLIDRLKQ